MNLKYLRNDIRRNPGVTVALVFVLTLSAFLLATGAMVMERTIAAVSTLSDQAKPPHFLQMHKGDYSEKALRAFAADRSEIKSWLVLEMVGYDSTALTWNKPDTGESGSFSESLIDNLFVTQNDEFDFLLDERNVAVRPGDGQVYVPVAYQQRFDLQVGDELSVRTDVGSESFVVAGFVRDAQMASSLSSATRLLVSDSDFERLRSAGGAPEIIVEYLLSDSGLAGELQTAYASDPALPNNGQAVTGEAIQLINSISDGMVAIALVFIAGLLIVIALLNVRFVIRGTLQDDVREIGAMRAIGIPARSISGLYLAKYVLMTFVACCIGGVLALFASLVLTRSVQQHYAEGPVTASTFIVPLVALAGVLVIVVALCAAVLRRINRIEVVNALVHASTLSEKQAARHARRRSRDLRRSAFGRFRSVGIVRQLALIDVRADARAWMLLPVVFVLVSILIVLPTNLLTTFESPKFVTYMGAPQTDVRIDLQFTDQLDEIREELEAALASDPRVTEVQSYANELVEIAGENGPETMRVEVGSYAENAIEYVRGSPPQSGGIALSVLNSEKYGADVGDNFVIRRENADVTLTVSGVYQDVTSGGHTAKMSGLPSGQVSGYLYYVETSAGVDPAVLSADYSERFPDAASVPLKQYAAQSLSYLTDALRNVAVIAVVFGLGVIALITTLFLGLRIATERRQSAVLSAVGFSGSELAELLRSKALLLAATGVLVGVILAATVGESLVAAGISLAGLGVSNLSFRPNPLLVYVAYPLLLLAVSAAAAAVVASRLRRASWSEWLRS